MTNYKRITKDLLRMMEDDQKMRHKAFNDHKEWNEKVDKLNTEKLKNIIDEIGWPTISKVGFEASKAAWLLAQHADHDLVFQKKVLKFIKEAAMSKDVEAKQVAYLTDRILIKEGKKQVYGTQFRKNKKGSFIPLPLEDPDEVNLRRKSMGLGTIEEYKEELSKEII